MSVRGRLWTELVEEGDGRLEQGRDCRSGLGGFPSVTEH